MGAYQVVFTVNAADDLEEIVRYIAQDNPDAAQFFGDRL
jgi:plasmid stabilization system protein ParE